MPCGVSSGSSPTPSLASILPPPPPFPAPRPPSGSVLSPPLPVPSHLPPFLSSPQPPFPATARGRRGATVALDLPARTGLGNWMGWVREAPQQLGPLKSWADCTLEPGAGLGCPQWQRLSPGPLPYNLQGRRFWRRGCSLGTRKDQAWISIPAPFLPPAWHHLG